MARLATTKCLARALEQLDDPKLAEMIKKARDGYYDDYKTTIATPIVQLVMDLDEAGYHDMARRARDGEWDAQEWEGREWFSREGRKLFGI